MKLPEIIGIAGTNGSGKDTLADLRFSRQGARKVSLSDILRVEASKRGISHERENLRAISREWAQKFGGGVLSKMTIDDYRETRSETENGLSIVSVRHVSEAAAIQENGGAILWLDADQKIRYDRIQNANRRRVDDRASLEEFIADEERELHPSQNSPFEVNMAAVRDMSDIQVINEFHTKDEFENYLMNRFQL